MVRLRVGTYQAIPRKEAQPVFHLQPVRKEKNLQQLLLAITVSFIERQKASKHMNPAGFVF
jgi:hypothetical protein